MENKDRLVDLAHEFVLRRALTTRRGRRTRGEIEAYEQWVQAQHETGQKHFRFLFAVELAQASEHSFPEVLAVEKVQELERDFRSRYPQFEFDPARILEEIVQPRLADRQVYFMNSLAPYLQDPRGFWEGLPKNLPLSEQIQRLLVEVPHDAFSGLYSAIKVEENVVGVLEKMIPPIADK